MPILPRLSPLGPLIVKAPSVIRNDAMVCNATGLNTAPSGITDAFDSVPQSLAVVVYQAIGDAASGPSSVYASGWQVSGGGLTWTERQINGSTCLVATEYSVACGCWTAPVTSLQTMQVTVSHPTPANSTWATTFAVYQLIGVDLDDPIGSIVQGGNSQGQGAASLTLSPAPQATSLVLAYRQMAAVEAISLTATPGSGWSEIDEVLPGYAGLPTLHIMGRSGSASPTVAWDDICDPPGITVEASMNCAIEFLVR